MQFGNPEGRSPRLPALLASIVLAGGFVALLCTFFTPRWETNDDLAMSMVAHGYGIAAYGSPRLVFSNVLWGGIVRSLPSIGDLFGYSLGMLLALTLAAVASMYYLLRAGAGYVVSLLVLVLLFARPVLFPQFTITAGLLAASAVLAALAFAREGSLIDLIAACCLGFLAFLIRVPELLLVFGIGMLLLPWPKLVRSRTAWWAALGFVLCIAAATAIDIAAYSGPEWQAFWQRNLARAPFTDFGAVKRVLQHPEVMQRLGFSENDIRLVGNFFFADPKLMDPNSLRTLLGESPVELVTAVSFATGYGSVLAIFGPRLLMLAFASLALVILSVRPNRIAAWIMCLLIMFALGVAGRPDTARVYIPLFSLLILTSCAARYAGARWRHAATICILLVAGLLNTRQLRVEAAESDKMVELSVGKFVSPQSTVVWGASLPYQFVFPVLIRKSDVREARIYGLGVLTSAPFAVPVADERSGNGMLVRLRSEAGIPLIASEGEQALLNTYCVEHYGVPLRLTPISKTELWTVMNASCAPTAKQGELRSGGDHG
ncbi:hypothetical protein JQ633_32365 [Bradyrhizobium tropiciagri]|uniref:hypothetical protein n=1 Tax=Bradyrhizobium tropiciagri TaxID=312253 RepID=UPI001BA67366|nr:hypothetical protein [Bradyrhizobium tropiciagri]MBR0875092.1 hypothetical protein [Bradyrhizobium tropiciagri]